MQLPLPHSKLFPPSPIHSPPSFNSFSPPTTNDHQQSLSHSVQLLVTTCYDSTYVQSIVTTYDLRPMTSQLCFTGTHPPPAVSHSVQYLSQEPASQPASQHLLLYQNIH